MHLYIGLFLETCYTCTVLTCTCGVTTPKCSVLHNRILCQSLLSDAEELHTEPNMPHPMIDVVEHLDF